MPDETFTQTTGVAKKLQAWRKNLLDLSRGNRLLYFKHTKSSCLPIEQPQFGQLFEQIVVRGKKLRFPKETIRQKDLFDTDDSPQAGDEPVATAARKPSGEIDSPMALNQLMRALYHIRSRARLSLQEQGVNVLFLTFGVLQWRDSAQGEVVESPLLLVPSILEREGLQSPYTLGMLEEDIVLNPALVHKLDIDFRLTLPEIPDDMDEEGLHAYLKSIERKINAKDGWQVVEKASLGIFSFQKINLYADLERHADLFGRHPLIRALSGLGSQEPRVSSVSAEDLDDKVEPETVFQVLDADSSQQEAIEAAKSGISFVLQGPPGTGKSQTIANIIAEFLAAGKKVLFVSAKMAALEVVHRRLSEIGLAEFTLQLHSHKRDKREVVTELMRALDSPGLKLKAEYKSVIGELKTTRAELNAFVRALHKPRFALQMSAFEASGRLALLEGQPSLTFEKGDPRKVDPAALHERQAILRKFARYSDVIRDFKSHPWRGVVVEDLDSGGMEKVESALIHLLEMIPAYKLVTAQLAGACGLHEPGCLVDTENLLRMLKGYTPSLFALDLDSVSSRFQRDYKVPWKWILPAYRKDRRDLAAARRDSSPPSYREAKGVMQRALELKRTLGTSAPVPLDREAAQTTTNGAKDLASAIVSSFRVIADLHGGELPTVGGERTSKLSFEDLCTWLGGLRGNLGRLTEWMAFRRLCREATVHQLQSFVGAAISQGLPGQHWPSAYEHAFWKAFLDSASSEDSALRDFDSRSHGVIIERFRELDRRQLDVARARVRAAVSDRRPNLSWVDAPSAEQAILRREGAKKRRLMPLRRLFAEVPRLILDLKPCLMMSPITVGMLIDPKLYSFDLVVFDEASQIPPEEAVGAIVRGRQAIVVGDTQQLPPTRFFDVLGDDDSDEDEFTSLDEDVFDSILEECEGAGLRRKMLLWHYRSRHESLIAFSNLHFYNNRLYTFPSAGEAGAGLGLHFIHVADGIYRRGKSFRRNDVEARRVVDLMFDHFKRTPDRSLGVVAFSQAQQEAIQAEWERRRLANPSFETYFEENGHESVFIKNLETVQGDERDVIIFSIGYGKDEAGKLTLNFGPLNRAGGHRRLNVAITRARCEVYLVSSILPEEVDLARTSSIGVQRLRQYMEVARDGLRALMAEMAVDSTAEFESPFEESVYEALTARGLSLDIQVGVSGYRIDMAVKDPKCPGRYLLGIECDGAAYHSAATARDRDRLRQQVLEGLGWRLHRIWSRDWLTNRKAETERVIESLVKIYKNQGTRPPAVTPDSPSVGDTFVVPSGTRRKRTYPPSVVYQEPVVLGPRRVQQAMDLAYWRAEVLEDVVRLVARDAPVHIEVLLETLSAQWGFKRMGARVRAAFMASVESALGSKRIRKEGDILWASGASRVLVRVPNEGETPRKIEHIPAVEIAEAALLCLQDARSLTEEDLARATASLLGYERMGEHVSAGIAVGVSLLKRSGRAVVADGKVCAREGERPPHSK